MSQSVKSVIALLVLIGLGGGWICWTEPRPTPAMSAGRYGFPAMGALSLAVLVWAEWLRRNRAPDFLRAEFDGYFERAGFCFVVRTAARNGTGLLQVCFQNRYARACEVRLQIQPTGERGFTGAGNPFRFMADIRCGGGEVGVAEVPLAVPPALEGRTDTVELAADVVYPRGRGRMLRVTDGLAVPGIADTGRRVLRAIDGALSYLKYLDVWSWGEEEKPIGAPVEAEFVYPADVASAVPADSPWKTVILWRPGDSDKASPFEDV